MASDVRKITADMQDTHDDKADDNYSDDKGQGFQAFYPFVQMPSALLSLICSALVLSHIYRSKTKATATSRTTATALPSRLYFATRTSRQHRTSFRRSSNSSHATSNGNPHNNHHHNHGGSITSGSTTSGPSPIYYRLVAAICFFDMLSSTALFFDPLIKVHDDRNDDEFANHWTCAAGGLFKVTGITCASSYNAALALYFYLVVCRSCSEAKLVKYLEWPWHVCLGVGGLMAFSIAGVWLQVYNPVSGAHPDDRGGCWPAPYPKGCTLQRDWMTVGNSSSGNATSTTITTPPVLIPCTRGDPYGWIYDLATTLGFVIVVCILLSTNWAIYRKVRRQEARNQQYIHPTTTTLSLAPPASASLSASLSLQPQASNANNNNNSSRTSPTTSKSRQVAAQSFLYCGGYLATYVILLVHTAVTGGVQHYTAVWYPFVRVLQHAMFPLQGFFNCLVYFRPRYLQWRRATKRGERAAATTVVTGDNNEDCSYYSRCEALRHTFSIRPVPGSAADRRLLRQQRSTVGRAIHTTSLTSQRPAVGGRGAAGGETVDDDYDDATENPHADATSNNEGTIRKRADEEGLGESSMQKIEASLSSSLSSRANYLAFITCDDGANGDDDDDDEAPSRPSRKKEGTLDGGARRSSRHSRVKFDENLPSSLADDGTVAAAKDVSDPSSSA